MARGRRARAGLVQRKKKAPTCGLGLSASRAREGDTLSGLGAMVGRGRMRGWARLVPLGLFLISFSFSLF
jgi:hypothetical protein